MEKISSREDEKIKKELFMNAWAEVRSNKKGRPSAWGDPQQKL